MANAPVAPTSCYFQRVTSELGSADKRMKLRYAGTCRLCGVLLAAGVDAIYERESKTVRCVECRTAAVELETGVAGASARREHERRAAKREERIRAKHPKIGGFILAVTDQPQSTEAWQRGAIGEEVLGERLKDLPAEFRVLHDRRIPGTRANIDHVVIGPGGVWVIDAKRYKGQRPTLHVEGGFIRPRVESLRVGGRNQAKLVTGVQSQVERVTDALADPTIPVTGALCFVEADWPLIGGSFSVDGIHVLWPRLLVERLKEPAPDSIEVTSAFALLARRFPSA